MSLTLILFCKTKFVLVKQLKGFYGFPKGHIEKGETKVETALREIKEETGLEVNLIYGFIASDKHEIPEKPNVMKKITYFLAEYDNQEIVYPKEELLSADLYSYEEAMELLQFERPKKILKDAKDFLVKKKLY